MISHAQSFANSDCSGNPAPATPPQPSESGRYSHYTFKWVWGCKLCLSHLKRVTYPLSHLLSRRFRFSMSRSHHSCPSRRPFPHCVISLPFQPFSSPTASKFYAYFWIIVVTYLISQTPHSFHLIYAQTGEY